MQFQEWRDIANVETDALLDSILTGETVQSPFDKPHSDTSSDSGCNFEQSLLSPEPASTELNLIEYISNHDEDEDDDDSPGLHAVVNPRTNSPEPEYVTISPATFETGATTIILPVITPVITAAPL
jgi:hypothetical protein